MENFDQNIIVIKFLLHDYLCLNYMANVDFKDYIKVEVFLLKENYELIEKVE
jgi:hypothetical protein